MLTSTHGIVKKMMSHKINDPEMIDVMHKAKLSHMNVMNVLREFVGGSENLNISEHNNFSTLVAMGIL
jgi:hypothetical protein